MQYCIIKLAEAKYESWREKPLQGKVKYVEDSYFDNTLEKLILKSVQDFARELNLEVDFNSILTPKSFYPYGSVKGREYYCIRSSEKEYSSIVVTLFLESACLFS